MSRYDPNRKLRRITILLLVCSLTVLTDLQLGAAGESEAFLGVDLSDNDLSVVPPEVWQHSAIQRLDLGFNNLKELPSDIESLPKLEYLDISANQLTILPTEISKLLRLKDLLADFNLLSSIPPVIGRLTALERLELSSNSLTNLPAEVENLRALKELSLCGNRLGSVPNAVCHLDRLERLTLGGNPITELPEEITNLSSLVFLEIHDTSLIHLDKELAKLAVLPNLRSLFFGSDKIRLETIPDEITKLTNIERLCINKIRLGNPEADIEKLAELRNLQELILAFCEVGRVPRNIRLLRKLKVLDVTDIEIHSFPKSPDEIGGITELRFSGGDVSQEEKEAVIRSLPGCRVIF